jgi:hypothetical protein
MKRRNRGSVTSAIMLMHYKKVSRSMFEIVIPKKVISKYAIFVVTRQLSIITSKNTSNERTKRNGDLPVTFAMPIFIERM